MTTFNYKSPLGNLKITCNDSALSEIKFTSQCDGDLEPLGEVAESVKRWLDCYFSGGVPDFMPPLEPQGTPFRQRVWSIIANIPYGSTLTYGDIAKIIATERRIEKMSAQAVGGAVGANPIPIIIPCHRVIGASGKLVGYTGSLDKKIAMLKLEGVI